MNKKVDFHKIVPESRVNKGPAPPQIEQNEDQSIWHCVRNRSSNNNKIRRVTNGESKFLSEEVENVKKKIKRFNWRKKIFDLEVQDVNSVKFSYNEKLPFSQLEQIADNLASDITAEDIEALLEMDISDGSSSTFG